MSCLKIKLFYNNIKKYECCFPTCCCIIFTGIREALNEILCPTFFGKVEFTFEVTYLDKQKQGVRNTGFEKSHTNHSYGLIFYYICKLKPCHLNNETYLLATSPQGTSPTILVPTFKGSLISTYRFSY